MRTQGYFIVFVVPFAPNNNSKWRPKSQAQVEVDSVVYNTVLAACVSAEQLDLARKLLDQMVEAGGVTDVITYNTLAKVGNPDNFGWTTILHIATMLPLERRVASMCLHSKAHKMKESQGTDYDYIQIVTNSRCSPLGGLRKSWSDGHML